MFDTVNWPNVTMGAGLAIGLALVVAQLAARGVRMILGTVTGDAASVSFRDPIQRRPIRIIRGLVFVGVLGLITRPILSLFGVELSVGVPLEALTQWLFQQGVRIVLIALLAYVAVRMAALGSAHFERAVTERAGGDADKLELVERVHTISGLLMNAVNVLVFGAATLMILRELGMDITPLLTGAGIAGLAVGFGAQNLVRDVISGFFLILEDQVHVGDVVEINGTAGLVQSVKLRTIVLRDLSGTVHVIPNGAITTLSNKTVDFSYAVIDVGVAYKEDTDHVSDVLRDVGGGLESDPGFSDHILDRLEILGVSEFGDSAVVIKIRIKTRPLKQWMVARELRRRIKRAFDADGIEIPFPHLSVYFGEASKAFLTHQLEVEAIERAALATGEGRARDAEVSRSKAGAADGEAEADGGYE